MTTILNPIDRSADLLAIFGACEHDQQAFIIPETLDKTAARAFKQLVESMGAVWNRKLKAHIFPDGVDIEEMIRDVFATRCFVDPRLLDHFATPDELAARMVALARIGPGHLCLEPSAGNGVLARHIRDAGATQVLVCELLDGNAQGLAAQGFQLAGRDFLTYHKILSGQDRMPFDRVVLTPPFGRGQDRAHVLAAWDLVKDDGVLVAVVSDGAIKRTDLAVLVARWGTAEELPLETFARVGGHMPAHLLVLEKTVRGRE